jgi:hypothetical protein
MDRPEKWALAATTLIVVFSVLGVACYLFARGVFMGQLPEVIVVGIIVVVWAGALPVIMNPANDIAVSFNDYLNANLYFGSWLSFFCALVIAGELAKELYGMDVVGVVSPVARGKHGKWYALIATSIVVLSSSVRVFQAFECNSTLMMHAPGCRQTKFAIAAGVLGTVFAMFATLFLARGTCSTLGQGCSSVIMALIWSFGLGYITFGEGPGQNIGNLYFSTWASFTLSIFLVAESFRDYMGVREQQRRDASMPDDDLMMVVNGGSGGGGGNIQAPTSASAAGNGMLERPTKYPSSYDGDSFEDAEL